MFQLLNPETKLSGVDHQHCRGKTKRRISKVFLPDSLSFACEGLVGTVQMTANMLGRQQVAMTLSKLQKSYD